MFVIGKSLLSEFEDKEIVHLCFDHYEHASINADIDLENRYSEVRILEIRTSNQHMIGEASLFNLIEKLGNLNTLIVSEYGIELDVCGDEDCDVCETPYGAARYLLDIIDACVAQPSFHRVVIRDVDNVQQIIDECPKDIEMVFA